MLSDDSGQLVNLCLIFRSLLFHMLLELRDSIVFGLSKFFSIFVQSGNFSRMSDVHLSQCSVVLGLQIIKLRVVICLQSVQLKSILFLQLLEHKFVLIILLFQLLRVIRLHGCQIRIIKSIFLSVKLEIFSSNRINLITLSFQFKVVVLVDPF